MTRVWFTTPFGPLGVVDVLVGLAVLAGFLWAVWPRPVRCCRACGWRKGRGHARGCAGAYGYWTPPQYRRGR